MRGLFTIGCCLVLAGSIASGQGRPNVVFILADDLGWADLGCMGSPLYQSPNIDRIADSGIKFMHAYAANPLCSPTRASVMTGLWPSRIGITTPGCHLPREILETYVEELARPDLRAVAPVSATRLKTEYETIAESFKRAGYATAHIGKWHLGPEPYDPLHQGFDVDIPHTPDPSPMPDGFFAPWPVYPGEGKTGDHLEDRMAEESIMAAMKGGIFTRDEFFCHFPHYTPATGNIPASSVRKGDWKLIRFWHDNYDQAHRHELYNLRRDIGETTDLSSLHADKVEELNILLDQYIEKTGTLVPIANPNYLNFEK